jgi:hypothetical protein
MAAAEPPSMALSVHIALGLLLLMVVTVGVIAILNAMGDRDGLE